MTAARNGNGSSARQGGHDPLLRELVANALFLREQLFRRSLDPRRDVAAECGHPPACTAAEYQALYERDPVANRAVRLWPDECWQVWPEVYESEDPAHTTPFEKALYALSPGLRGEPEGREDRECSALWEPCHRLDVLAGVGRYGVLLLGLDDGLPTDRPAAPAPGRRLLFLRAYPETAAAIESFDEDPASPRFGLPESYSLALEDDGAASADADGGATAVVHWSRVLHLADNLESSEVYGAPRLRPVLNRVLDLEKLYGGSAEMYWKGAFPGLAFESAPAPDAMGAETEVDLDSVRDMIERYQNGLQRYLTSLGMTVKSIAPQVADPTAQIAAQLDAVCVQLQVPRRVFTGSERGELASGQDAVSWAARVRRRRQGFLTPRLIRPVLNRLIALGVLPDPPAGYAARWPDSAAQSELDKANVALRVSQALSAYAASDTALALVDYLTHVLGWDDNDAIEAATNAAREREENQRKALQAQAAMTAAAAPLPAPAAEEEDEPPPE